MLVRTTAIALMFFAGCSDGPTEPAYDFAPYVGTWQIAAEPIFGCISEGADFFMEVAIDGETQSSDGIFNVTTEWGSEPEMTQDYPLTGHFNLADQRFELVLWRVGVRSEFSGTIDNASRISGTWDIPRNFFNTFACPTPAVATRVSE